MTLPLAGLTVLDFSTLLPGPMATLFLAEAGARVIKVERPEGEDMRFMGPMDGEASFAFRQLNAGKEIVRLDLKQPEVRAQVLAMVREADILIEQFRPGVMARLGFGYDTLKEINPRLIYCAISGYGQSGPRAQEAGHDINYQALSGLLSLAPGQGGPSLPAALTADLSGGTMSALVNILLALLRRQATGEGAFIDTAMTDGLFMYGWLGLSAMAGGGASPAPHSLPLTGAYARYRLYTTRDGRVVACGALEDKFWTAFCGVIGLDPQAHDGKSDTARTVAAVQAILGAEDAAYWEPRLAAADCCVTLVKTLDEALQDPHFVARGLFAYQVEGTSGPVPALPLPLDPSFRADPQQVRGIRA